MKKITILALLISSCGFATMKDPMAPSEGDTIIIESIELTRGDRQSFIVHFKDISGGYGSFNTYLIDFNVNDTVLVYGE